MRATPYDSTRHRRRSIRIPGHDYGQPGAYAATVCLQDRCRRFGRVEDGAVRLSRAGLVIEVMPDHFHGIVWIDAADPSSDGVDRVSSGAAAGCSLYGGDLGGEGNHGGLPLPNASPRSEAGVTLPRIMNWFKSATTADYWIGIRLDDWPPLPGRLWQRNYFERVVRDERELGRLRAYIDGNPARWRDDEADGFVGAD